MTDLSRAGKTILIVICTVSLLSIAINLVKPKIVYIPDPNIPSQREIQQRLEDLDDPRYDPNGVDGWIGNDSRTAWDNYICDQYAKKTFDNLQ